MKLTKYNNNPIAEIERAFDGFFNLTPVFHQLEEVYKTGAGGEVYKDVDEQITGGITNLEKFLKGKKGFKEGGDVSLTVIKIPDISESGVESLFKRR